MRRRDAPAPFSTGRDFVALLTVAAYATPKDRRRSLYTRGDIRQHRTGELRLPTD